MDEHGFPLGMLVLVLLVMPVGVALFFGLFALRPVEPSVFSCLRCGASFRQQAWKPYLALPALWSGGLEPDGARLVNAAGRPRRLMRPGARSGAGRCGAAPGGDGSPG